MGLDQGTAVPTPDRTHPCSQGAAINVMPEMYAERMLGAAENLLAATRTLKRNALLNDTGGIRAKVSIPAPVRHVFGARRLCRAMIGGGGERAIPQHMHAARMRRDGLATWGNPNPLRHRRRRRQRGWTLRLQAFEGCSLRTFEQRKQDSGSFNFVFDDGPWSCCESLSISGTGFPMP